MAVMNEKVGRMLKKRQGIESEYSQVSEPEAEFSTQQYRPYQGNYEWESPMNQKVQDLLEKRAPKWYETGGTVCGKPIPWKDYRGG